MNYKPSSVNPFASNHCFLQDGMHRKMLFETMQNELEEVTEMLSQMVARVYLRTPKAKIVETAQILQQARLKFVDAVANGLIPSSPSIRDKMKTKKWELYIFNWPSWCYGKGGTC